MCDPAPDSRSDELCCFSGFIFAVTVVVGPLVLSFLSITDHVVSLFPRTNSAIFVESALPSDKSLFVSPWLFPGQCLVCWTGVLANVFLTTLTLRCIAVQVDSRLPTASSDLSGKRNRREQLTVVQSDNEGSSFFD